MHTERLLQSIGVRRLVSIAQAIFLLERVRQTYKQTDMTEHYTHAGVITKAHAASSRKHPFICAIGILTMTHQGESM